MNPKGNPQNLAPQFRSGEEARKNGHKGGVSSGKTRREKKTIASTTKSTLYKLVKDPKQLEIIRKSGLHITGKPTYLDFLVASVVMKSISRGRVDDLLKLMEVIGEKANDDIAVDEKQDDALSASLRELAAELERSK